MAAVQKVIRATLPAAMCAITSLILGLGLTTTACYIFLAILVGPALEKAGLNRMAVHMFIFYWGMLSSITPPVAIASFAAAGIAGAPAMKTGWESMWVGSIIYFIPFFFVANPALVLQATDGGVALTRCLAGGGGSLWVRLGVGEDDRVEGDEARVEFAEGALVDELGDPLSGGYAEVVPARCADTVALLQALLKEELGAPGAAQP